MSEPRRFALVRGKTKDGTIVDEVIEVGKVGREMFTQILWTRLLPEEDRSSWPTPDEFWP